MDERKEGADTPPAFHPRLRCHAPRYDKDESKRPLQVRAIVHSKDLGRMHVVKRQEVELLTNVPKQCV